MKKILLVEDSQKTQSLIIHSLGKDFQVFVAETAPESLHYCRAECPDLILLDINLGTDSGYSILDQLKRNDLIQDTPVIFLTEEESKDSKVLAFNLGADDYITKPFNPKELDLRVRARLKADGQVHNNVLKFHSIHINTSKLSAYIDLQEKGKLNLELSPTEIKLLQFFIQNENQVFSREQIFNKVWGDKTSYLDRTIDRHISSLRKKVGNFGKCIRTIYGAGYMWDTSLVETQSFVS
ncbi:MAG: response regulator transcription factor [Bdellovibrionales bacterium]